MIRKLPKVQSVFGKAGQSGIPALSRSVGDAHCDDPAKKSPLQRLLALGRTLHRRTQHLSRHHCEITPSRPNKIRAERNKTEKSEQNE
jgi:hypothetical protein